MVEGIKNRTNDREKIVSLQGMIHTSESSINILYHKHHVLKTQ